MKTMALSLNCQAFLSILMKFIWDQNGSTRSFLLCTCQVSNLLVMKQLDILHIFVTPLWLLFDSSSLNFSAGVQCHVAKTERIPKNNNRKKLREYQISRNVFLCFTHKAAVSAMFSRNNLSPHVASSGEAQKPGAENIQRLLTFIQGYWLELLHVDSSGGICFILA